MLGLLTLRTPGFPPLDNWTFFFGRVRCLMGRGTVARPKLDHRRVTVDHLQKSRLTGADRKRFNLPKR